MVDGVVQDVQALTTLLASCAKKLKDSTVAICLPPRFVYCTTLDIPSAGRLRDAVTAAVHNAIPEDADQLLMQWRVLGRTATGQRVGVIAVRKDLVQSYALACRNAGLRLRSISTHTIALASTLQRGTTILVTALQDVTPTLTLVQRGWPTDEAVLPEDAEDDAIVDALHKVMAEWSRSVSIDSVYVVGSAALFQACTAALGLQGGQKKASAQTPQKKSPIAIAQVFAWLKATDVPFLVSIIAALLGPRSRDLRSIRRGETWLLLGTFLLALVACGAVIAVRRPDLVVMVYKWVGVSLPLQKH